ncbi:cache domain-containing sensor histidine kinase [Paenibacillus sp. SYP-B4298]|uniref:cache domain-containing sensor histidine kinase n=1 Tax=Paenibacillus sp. SYP-B4298 TaxID=2996034 RepID=UPI0022DE70C4|nr:sensor histidine kinase [Paenibacillus sp. SYP-B4298]
MPKTTPSGRGLLSLLRLFKVRGRIVFVIVAGLSLHLILMLSVFNLYGSTYLKNSLYDHIGNLQKEMSTSVELIVDDIQMIALRFLMNSAIYQTIGDENLDAEAKQAALHRLIADNISTDEMIGDVVIITHDNERFRYRSDDLVFENPDDLLIARVKASPIPITGHVKRDASGEAYIVFGQQYRSFNTGQNIGVLLIYVKESYLYALYESAFEGLGYSYIATSDKEIISHPDKAILGNVLSATDAFQPMLEKGYVDIAYGDRKYVLSIHPLGDRLQGFGVSWRIVSVISYPELFEAISQGNRNALLFTALTFIGLLGLSFYIAGRITRPIAKLTEKIRSFGQHGLEPLPDTRVARDEISELEHSYYSMIERINHLIEENSEEKEKQRIMELTALQSQINPHFLYNTLDAIKWTARLKKQPEIEQMISALSTFFRISLHKGDKHIPLGEEVKLVQSFVTVEQFRFPDKFDVRYDIPEHLRNVRILKLILQPLVENAIKHGLSEKEGAGMIEVRCWEEANCLYLEVKDNGVGFEQNEDIRSINKNPFFQSGYGLRNVDERIKLEYGDDSSLSISSRRGEGTTALITLNLTRYLL